MDCFINMASCNISQEAQVLHLPPPPPCPLTWLICLKRTERYTYTNKDFHDLGDEHMEIWPFEKNQTLFGTYLTNWWPH